MQRRKSNTSFGQHGHALTKKLQLGSRKSIIWFVGRCEVRKDPFKAEVNVRSNPLCQPMCITQRCAKASHAGVDLEMDGNWRSTQAMFERRAASGPGIRRIADRDFEARAARPINLACRDGSQHQDRSVDAKGTEFFAFPDGCYAQSRRAAFERGSRRPKERHGHKRRL